MELKLVRKRSEDVASSTTSSSIDSMNCFRLDMQDLLKFRTVDPSCLKLITGKHRPSKPCPPIRATIKGFQIIPDSNSSEQLILLPGRSQRHPAKKVADRKKSCVIYKADHDTCCCIEDICRDRCRNRHNAINPSITPTYVSINIDRTNPTDQFERPQAVTTDTYLANRQADIHTRPGRTEDRWEATGVGRRKRVRHADRTLDSKDHAETLYGAQHHSPRHLYSDFDFVPCENQGPHNPQQYANERRDIDKKAGLRSRSTDRKNLLLSPDFLNCNRCESPDKTICPSNIAVLPAYSDCNSLEQQFQRSWDTSGTGCHWRDTCCPESGMSDFSLYSEIFACKSKISQNNQKQGPTGCELDASNELAVAEHFCGRILDSCQNFERPRVRSGQNGTSPPPADSNRGLLNISMAVDLESLEILWQTVCDCEKAMRVAERKGFSGEDVALYQRWLENLGHLEAASHRLVMVLVTDLVRQSDRDDLELEEHQLCRTVANLVAKTCRSITQTSDSKDRKTIIQVSKIHVQNMRVVLDLLSNLSLKCEDYAMWSSDFCETSTLFVKEAGERLLVLYELFNQVTVTTTVNQSRGNEETNLLQPQPSGGEGLMQGRTQEELRIYHQSRTQVINENLHQRTAQEIILVQKASRATKDTSIAFRHKVSGEKSTQETFDVVVNRRSETLLDDLVQFYANAPTKILHSKMKVDFVGEPGIDGGGALSREFFCLIFQALIDRTVKNRSVFEGERGHLLPSIDYVLNESRVFWVVGILVAQAAKNRCHGLPGLSLAIRQFLITGAKISSLDDVSHLATIDDVTDLELRKLLEKVKKREKLKKEEKTSWQTWLEKSGFSYAMSEARTDDAVKQVLRYFVFESRMSALVSIAEGMEVLGLRPIPDGFDVDVVFPLQQDISFNDFFRTIKINDPSGEHVRECEMAIGFFKTMCAELSEGKIENLSLSDLLHFFTGDPYLKSGITVSFMSLDQSDGYPHARTCNLELSIPIRHKTYDEFKTHFCQALRLGTYGFGSA